MSRLSPVTVAVPLTEQNVTLDWELRHDPLSMNYRIASRYPAKLHLPIRNRRWTKNVLMDQGIYRCPFCNQFGACVGYSCAHVMLTTPRIIGEGLDHVACHKIYHGAKTRDQWAGEAYEGSSVLGGMQYLKDVGALKSYFWAKTVHEIALGVSYFGPMVVGTDWLEDMFYPDSNGRIKVSGAEVGGHAYEIIGVSKTYQEFEIANTWGYRWGKDGNAIISFADMEKLIRLRGEFALPRKNKLGGRLILP